MGKWVVFGILLAILVVFPVGAVQFNLSIPDVAGTYKIFDSQGQVAKSGDFNKSASLNLSEGTYYLLLNTKEYSIFYPFTVTATTTNITVNLSALSNLAVNATFTNTAFGLQSISTDVKINPATNTNVSFIFATNWTVKFADDVVATFANETRQLIYKLKLDKVEVNGASVNLTDSKYTFTAGNNYNVVLYYASEYFISPTYLLIIIGIIAIGLVAIIVSTGKKAKQTILDKEVNDFRFFRRVR